MFGRNFIIMSKELEILVSQTSTTVQLIENYQYLNINKRNTNIINK